MTIGSLSPRPPRAVVVVRLNHILVFLVILSIVPIAHCQCNRRSSDTSSTPKFLCLFNVTFTRQADCSARVSETIIFPHTTGQNEFRVIQALPDVQRVSDILLERNDEPVGIRQNLSPDGTVTVTLPTERSTTPSTFVLSYAISNAAMRFTDGCGKGKPNPGNNVLRWRTGPLGKVIDSLAIRFSTTEDRTLTVVGGSSGQSRNILFKESQFGDEADFSVEEAGGNVCKVDQVCFSRPVAIWQISVILVLIGVPALLTVTCLVMFTICDVCGLRSEVEGDDPIDESEMVGFRHGRYSDCIPNDDGFGGCECKKEREFFDIE